jgi:hypothetical protein
MYVLLHPVNFQKIMPENYRIKTINPEAPLSYGKGNFKNRKKGRL